MDAGVRIVELEKACVLPGSSAEPERCDARPTADRARRSERRDRSLPGTFPAPWRRRGRPGSLASRSSGRLTRRAAACRLSGGAARGYRGGGRRSGAELERADVARTHAWGMTLVCRRAGRRLPCVDGGTARLERGGGRRPSVEGDE